jgi:hypothetical protein
MRPLAAVKLDSQRVEVLLRTFIRGDRFLVLRSTCAFGCKCRGESISIICR